VAQEGDKTMDAEAKEGEKAGDRTQAFVEKQDPDFDPNNADDVGVEEAPEEDAAEVGDGARPYACPSFAHEHS
jgi:hypothetical protein